MVQLVKTQRHPRHGLTVSRSRDTAGVYPDSGVLATGRRWRPRWHALSRRSAAKASQAPDKYRLDRSEARHPAELPVAGVAETGHDECLLVEAFVDRRCH